MEASWRIAGHVETAKYNWQACSKYRVHVSSEMLVLFTSAFLLITANLSFWKRLSIGLGEFSQAWPSYIAVAGFLLAFLSLFLALAPRISIKPLLSLIFIICAFSAYFMDSYGAVIDRHALQSVMESDARESAEWLSSAMLWPLLMFGFLPVTLLWKFVIVKPQNLRTAIKRKALFLSVCAGTAALILVLNFQTFSSLGRNHAVLRDLFNPVNVINAVRGQLKRSFAAEPRVLQTIAPDAQRGPSFIGIDRKPLLFVLVIGESARAASFGLHGYARNTTPELAKLPLTVFTHVQSCGTNTATSVPCMFSNLGRQAYDENTANSQENVLDVIKRAGFNVLWLDNNTGSKNVARRIEEIDLAHGNDANLCAGDSCYDEIMLQALEARIATIKVDTVIVLHALGSHGPAYFQRTPAKFAKFQPICESVELHHCSRDALINSYDNSIVYTDYVLSELIARLNQKTTLDTALLYVSDHGESTGENGFYLHGAPFAIAPDEQTQIPMFLWQSAQFSARRKLDMHCVSRARIKPTSHDALFPMLLDLLDVRTGAYIAERDPLAACSAN